MLRTAELRLQEANERIAAFDRSDEDKTHTVAELSSKVVLAFPLRDGKEKGSG